MRLVPIVHELTYKIWPMPSSTSLLLVCFAKVQVRLRESAVSPDPSLLAHAIELAYKIWLSRHLHPSFKCDLQRLWRDCANMQSCLILFCLIMG